MLLFGEGRGWGGGGWDPTYSASQLMCLDSCLMRVIVSPRHRDGGGTDTGLSERHVFVF